MWPFIPFYVAAFRTPDGLLHRALCAMDDAEAAKDAARMDCGELLSVVRRETPEWRAVAPRRVAAIRGRRDVRDHFLKGGTVLSVYRGRSYLVAPEIFGEDREIVDGCGAATVAIGRAVLTCEERPGHARSFLLEPLDEEHALDLLDGKLLEFDAGLQDG